MDSIDDYVTYNRFNAIRRKRGIAEEAQGDNAEPDGNRS
jgi:hypothetical protein